MLAFDPDSNFQENRVNMTRAWIGCSPARLPLPPGIRITKATRSAKATFWPWTEANLDFVEDQLPKAFIDSPATW